MLLLDSSIILEIINGTEKSKKILQHLKGELFTTSFSIYEIFLGIKENEILILEKLVSVVNILSFDINSSLISVQLMKNLTKSGKKLIW